MARNFLFYSTLRCKKLARSDARSKSYMPAKLGAETENIQKFCMQYFHTKPMFVKTAYCFILEHTSTGSISLGSRMVSDGNPRWFEDDFSQREQTDIISLIEFFLRRLASSNSSFSLLIQPFPVPIEPFPHPICCQLIFMRHLKLRCSEITLKDWSCRGFNL